MARGRDGVVSRGREGEMREGVRESEMRRRGENEKV